MSTTKLFILIMVVFVLLLIFVVGFNPFSFGDAYFRPRDIPAETAPEPSYIVLPDNAAPTEVKIDR